MGIPDTAANTRNLYLCSKTPGTVEHTTYNGKQQKGQEHPSCTSEHSCQYQGDNGHPSPYSDRGRATPDPRGRYGNIAVGATTTHCPSPQSTWAQSSNGSIHDCSYVTLHVHWPFLHCRKGHQLDGVHHKAHPYDLVE